MRRFVGNGFGCEPHSKLSLQADQVARKLQLKGAMSSIRLSLYSALMAALFITLSIQTSFAQAPTTTIVRTVLAVTSLPSVVDAPLFFKLSRVELPQLDRG
jgi:hypothetical protein